MLTLSSRLDAVDKKLLYLFHVYGKAISKRRVHHLVYELQASYGVDLGFKFLGSPPFSQELEERLESLVSRGLLKKLYVVGGSFTALYKPFFSITEKGAKAIERKDFSRNVQEAIEKLVATYKRKYSTVKEAA